MAGNIIEERGSVNLLELQPRFEWLGRRTYECRILLCPEKAGGFSAHALRLPGVVSQGESIDEAINNVADAFQTALQTYEEQGMPVPWGDVDVDRPVGSIERWILVNV